MKRRHNWGKMMTGILALTMLLAASANPAAAISSETQAETAAEETALPHSLGLTGVKNARDLGEYVLADGRVVKSGLLLRTAALSAPTEEDIAKLEELGLSLIIDLRAESEKAAAPDAAVPGAEYVEENVMETAMAEMAKAVKAENLQFDPSDPSSRALAMANSKAMQSYMQNLYISLLTSEEGQRGYADMFRRILAADGKCVLWHCTSGKDRCGTAAALILFALGADRETVIEDFALSNAYYADTVRQMQLLGQSRNVDQDALDCLQAMVGVVPAYMNAALDLVDEQYGSMDNYLHEVLGLSDADLQALRDAYTE